MEIAQIKTICQQYGLVPNKLQGQNFLLDEKVAEKIAVAAKGETILEVGPGLGALTQELIKGGRRVIAVEKDKKAAAFLRANFFNQKSLTIVEDDILRVSLTELGLKKFNYSVAANLPYSITANFLRLFLEREDNPQEMVLMVQREVAERVCAPVGEMSILAVSAQFYSEARILFAVPRASFWPQPKVDSAVISLKLKKKLPTDDSKGFFRLVKIGFSSRRKQLHNNLSAGLHLPSTEVKKILNTLGFNELIRAQDLSVEDWLALGEQFGF